MSATETEKSAPQLLEAQQVNGFEVPAFWVPSPGDYTAGLTFRVGRATEPMALRGISRLVEHIVGMALDHTPPLVSVSPASEFTTFSHTGTADEVAHFLYNVSWTLASLPLEYVDPARHAIEGERWAIPTGNKQRLLTLRHGFSGPGAGATDMYGIKKSGHRQVHSWTTRNFHKSNAALFISGPELPSLPMRIVNAPRSSHLPTLLEVPTPGYGKGESGTIAISFVAKKSQAIIAGMTMAEFTARDELCDIRNIADNVQFEYHDLPGGMIEYIIEAYCAAGEDGNVLAILLDVLQQAAIQPPDERMMDMYREQIARRITNPRNAASFALSHAQNLLNKRTNRSNLELLNQAVELTPTEVSQSLMDALSSTLVVCDPNLPALKGRFELVDNWTPYEITGKPVRAMKQKGDSVTRELQLSGNGISRKQGERVDSMRFSDVGVMLADPINNTRELVSDLGRRIFVRPQDWEYGDKLIERLDQEITNERRILTEPPVENGRIIDRRLDDRS